MSTQRRIKSDVRRWMSAIRRQYPTIHPVKIKRRRLKDDDGYSTLKYIDEKPAYYVIVLDSRLTGSLLFDTLVHEMAHILMWTHESEEDDHHCDVWGMWYARVYRCATKADEKDV